jgi:GMP synthase (glutamine-hydrolysing)
MRKKIQLNQKRKEGYEKKDSVEPEEKRRIIGREFVRVFETVARRVGATYLIQGTIYPDRIESGVRKFSDKIKTHHNVAGLPTKMEFKRVVEPLLMDPIHRLQAKSARK